MPNPPATNGAVPVATSTNLITVTPDATKRGHGIRESGVSIPDYVPTTDHTDPPATQLLNYSGKPAYFRFAVPSVDSTGLVTRGSDKEKMGQYYKDKTNSPFYKRLTTSRANRQNLFIAFSLQKVRENFQEKFQIIDTYGDSFTSFFFGQKPLMLSISGILIDDQLSDWKAQMLYVYHTFLRGFHISKHKILVEFGYGNVTAKGVLLNLETETGDVTNEVLTNFSAQMLVYKYYKYSSGLSKHYDAALKDVDYSTGKVGELANARFINKVVENNPVYLTDMPPGATRNDKAYALYEVEQKVAANKYTLASDILDRSKNCSGQDCPKIASDVKRTC